MVRAIKQGISTHFILRANFDEYNKECHALSIWMFEKQTSGNLSHSTEFETIWSYILECVSNAKLEDCFLEKRRKVHNNGVCFK